MTSPCSEELLESALAGDLPPEREQLLHRHLEECQACTTSLERMAGGADLWREAAVMFAGDEVDDALSARDEWSNIDFTVEHLEPADEPGVLGRLGGYDVLEIIGRGGMGVVLKGFDPELKRCVAIKVLSPHLALSSLARKRFAREAQAAAAVVHANVLAIHQVQPAGRLPFLVMPLVAGESLAQRLTAQGRLELKEVLRVGMQAAAGLSAAHEQGLVHRDVKPANILLEKGVERAVLTDFGLARAADDVSMTRWGIIAGTPQYMSPEQARGEPVDGRSDLFSLGCVLYEMATGVSPFRADSTLATLRRLIDDPPPAMASHDPELPPWFIGIVERLLEKEPSKRFGSAKEVSELLEGCLAHLQQPASVPLPADLPMSATRLVSKRPRTLFKRFIAMIATLGIVLLGMVAIQATSPPDISGNWQGEDWGHVTLTQTAPGEYSGTYTDTVTKEKGPGKIYLKWSRIERRFNGTWREGEDDRFGEMSIHLVGNEIRGGLTTDSQSKVNPATPRLADLTWTRARPTSGGTASMPSPPNASGANSAAEEATGAQSRKSLNFGSAAMMVIQKYSTSDKVLSGSLVIHDDAWIADVKSPQTLRLFERTQPCSEDCTVFYRAKLRTEHFEGDVYLEMWCRFPDGREFYSRGLNKMLSGTTDWVSCETPYFLKTGERPNLIRLNVVANGHGIVKIKDVELLRTWSAPEGESARPAPENPSATAFPRTGPAVTGRVVTEPGGTGVAGATVSLVASGGRIRAVRDAQGRLHSELETATTAPDGRYTFSNISLGNYMVFISSSKSPRVQPAGVWSEGIYFANTERHVSKQQDIRADDLCLKLPQSISGTVRDADTGEPVADAQIQLRASGLTNISTYAGAFALISTDAQGRYRLYVHSSKVELQCEGTPERYEADDPSSWRSTVVEPGRETTVDFRCKSGLSAPGRVVFPDGTPAKEANVRVSVLWPPLAGATARVRMTYPDFKTDSEGRFTGYMRRPDLFRRAAAMVGQGPVSIEAYAWLPDGSLGGVGRSETPSGGPLAVPLVVKLKKTGTAVVRVLWDDGMPARRVHVDAETGRFYNQSGEVTTQGVQHVGHIGVYLGDGRYQIAGLIPGLTWSVSAFSEGLLTGSQARDIEVKPGQTIDAGEIRLDGSKGRPGGRSGRGRTHDQKPAPGTASKPGSEGNAAIPLTVTFRHPNQADVNDFVECRGQVEAGDPLRIAIVMDEATYVRLRRLALAATDGRGNLPPLAPDWARTVTLFYALADEKGFEHQAKTLSAPERIDAGGGARWSAAIPKSDGLAALGMAVRAKLVIEPRHTAISILEPVIRAEQGQSYVYVLNDRNVLQRRFLRLGQLDGGLRVVEGGLSADDWVAVSDMEDLRPGMIVQPNFAERPAAPRSWTHQLFDQNDRGLTSYDFGTLVRGVEAEHRFRVENCLSEDAHIQVAARSWGGATVELPKGPIKPGEKADVVVKVDTSQYQGQLDATISVLFDKPVHHNSDPVAILRVYCFLRNDVLINPGVVSIRAGHSHATQQTAHIRYIGPPGWEILRVESANPCISGSLKTVSRKFGDTAYDLTVTVAADAKAGSFSDPLTLVTNDTDPRAQRIMVPVEVSVEADGSGAADANGKAFVTVPAAELPKPRLVDAAQLSFDQIIYAQTFNGANDQPVFVDLDTRRYMVPPRTLWNPRKGVSLKDLTFTPELTAWIRRLGIDVAVQTDGKSITVIGFDLEVGDMVLPGKDSKVPDLSPADVVQRVRRADSKELKTWQHTFSPSEFFMLLPFVTREGGIGNFHIWDITDLRGPNTFGLQYQLARQQFGDRKSPQVPEPAILGMFEGFLKVGVKDESLQLRVPPGGGSITFRGDDLVVSSLGNEDFQAARICTGFLDVDAVNKRIVVFGRGRQAVLTPAGNKVHIEMGGQSAEADEIPLMMPELKVWNSELRRKLEKEGAAPAKADKNMPGSANKNEGDRSIDKSAIIAALKRRQARFRSGDITWSEDRTKTRWSEQGKNGDMESGVHEGVIHIEHERFAFDGEKKMYYETAGAGYGCNGPGQPWERYISTFNGHEQRSYNPPGNPLVKHALGDIGGPTEQWSDLQTLGFRPIILACRPLHPRLCDLDSDDFTLDPTEAMIDGHRCAVLKATETESPGHEETYWLDRDRDWVIVKYQSSYRRRRGHNTGQTTVAEVSYQNDAIHGWVPSAWRTEWRNPNTGAIYDVQEAKVVKYGFNEAIPSELFDLSFPPGTFVRDNTQGNPNVYWVAMPGSRKHVLTEAERKATVSYEELMKKEHGKSSAPK